MKTARNLFAFIFFVFVISGNTYALNGTPNEGYEIAASEKFAYSIFALQSSIKFRLNFDNEDGSDVTVKIFTPDGKLAYSETIKRQVELRRNYDLSALGKGIYTVEVIDGDFKASHKIGVGVSAPQGEFNAYMSKLNEGSIRVAYQNATEGYASIVLRDEKGNIVYDEVSQDAQYARKFNLSKLNKGTYTMSITSGKKTVEQVYSIQ
jgi:hypothetical protein